MLVLFLFKSEFTAFFSLFSVFLVHFPFARNMVQYRKNMKMEDCVCTPFVCLKPF